MRRAKALGLVLALLPVLAGCGTVRRGDGTANEKVIDLGSEVYAMVFSGASGVYDDIEAAGFSEIMEKANREYRILKPGMNAAKDQRDMIRELTEEGVSCIAVAPYDADALEDVLKDAISRGIDVCSFERPATPASREMHINPSGNPEIAETLMDAVLDLTGGEGSWAILSASSTQDRQNGWIGMMKEVMKADRFSGLELLEIAYGNDSYQTSYDQTRALLSTYADLRAILCTTATGLQAACDAAAALEAQVRITGFGLPSAMKEKIGDDGSCPYFFMTNPEDVGRLTGYISVALHENQISGEAGESFRAGDMGTFTVTEAADKGTEVIAGTPFKLDSGNIDEWSGIF